jgi:hypothetical protein
MDALRRKLVKSGTRRMQLEILRIRLVKIGGRVRELKRRRSACIWPLDIPVNPYGTLFL